MSLSIEVLVLHESMTQVVLKGETRSMAFRHPEADAVQWMPGYTEGTFSVTFVKGGVKTPVPHLFDPAEGETDSFAAYRRPAGFYFVDVPLEGVVAILCALENDVEDIEMQAQLDGLLETGDYEDGISLYTKVCEPGYEENKKGFLLANWNHITPQLQAWLNSEGYDLEWSDEWTTCDECGGLIRTSPTSYGWKLYGKLDRSGYTCGDCLKADPEAYLESMEGKSKQAVRVDIDPVEHGYILVNSGHMFESGFHPGQTDDPEPMSKTLRLNGVSRFLWTIPSVSQFDLSFNLYIHESIKDSLEEIRDLLKISS